MKQQSLLWRMPYPTATTCWSGFTCRAVTSCLSPLSTETCHISEQKRLLHLRSSPLGTTIPYDTITLFCASKRQEIPSVMFCYEEEGEYRIYSKGRHPWIRAKFRTKNVNKHRPQTSAVSSQQQCSAYWFLTWLMLNANTADIICYCCYCCLFGCGKGCRPSVIPF